MNITQHPWLRCLKQARCCVRQKCVTLWSIPPNVSSPYHMFRLCSSTALEDLWTRLSFTRRVLIGACRVPWLFLVAHLRVRLAAVMNDVDSSARPQAGIEQLNWTAVLLPWTTSMNDADTTCARSRQKSQSTAPGARCSRGLS